MSMGKPWFPPAYLPTGSASRPVSAWLYHMTYASAVVRLWEPFTLIFTGLSTDELVYQGLTTDELVYQALTTDEIIVGG